MNKRLVIILRNSLDFLTLDETLELLLLSKDLRTELCTPWLSVQLGLKILQRFEEEPVTAENCFAVLAKYGLTHVQALSDLFPCVQYSGNRLRNPCGFRGFVGWELEGLTSRRRHKLVIQQRNTWKDCATVFVGTHYWTSLSQTVQVPSSDTPRLLVVGTPIARRHDCKSVAKVEAQVFDETGQLLGVHRAQQECSRDLKYHHLFVSAVLPAGPTYTVIARFATKDLQFWAGNYGARLGYLYARVFALPV